MGLAFGGLHLGDIHMTEANGIVLEALTLRLVPFLTRANARCHSVAGTDVAPWGPGERQLQGIEAAVERQLSAAIIASSASLRTPGRGVFGPVL